MYTYMYIFQRIEEKNLNETFRDKEFKWKIKSL